MRGLGVGSFLLSLLLVTSTRGEPIRFRSSLRVTTWRAIESLARLGRASEGIGELVRRGLASEGTIEAVASLHLDPDPVMRALGACPEDRPVRDCLQPVLPAPQLGPVTRAMEELEPHCRAVLVAPVEADLEGALAFLRGRDLGDWIDRRLGDLQRVLQADPADPAAEPMEEPLRVELVPLPRHSLPPGTSLRSQSLGTLQVVERPLPSRPGDGLDIVLHEAGHHLFGSSRSFPRLLEGIGVLDPGAGRLLAGGLLEEALATIFGVRAGGELGIRPGTQWYQDSDIDRLARLLAPIFESYLERGRPLDEPFARLVVAGFRHLWPRAEARVTMAFGEITLVTGSLDPFRGMGELRSCLGAHSLWLAPLVAPEDPPPDLAALQGGAVAIFLTPVEARLRGMVGPGTGEVPWLRAVSLAGGKARLEVVATSLEEVSLLLRRLAAQSHLPVQLGGEPGQPGASTIAE